MDSGNISINNSSNNDFRGNKERKQEEEKQYYIKNIRILIFYVPHFFLYAHVLQR